MGSARNFCQRTIFTFCTEQPIVTVERIRLQGGGGVAPGVSPAGSVSTRTRPPEEMTNPHCDHSGHTSRCALFSSFSGPVPVPLPVCRQCEACGYSSHNGTGHHSAESLTGSTRQPSWRVMHGSVRHPVGQRFHSDDTVAAVRSIFPLTRGQVIRGPRYHALSGGTAPVLQRCSHILYRLFYPNSADHFQGAAHQFQLFCTDFLQIIQLTATLRATAFFRLQTVYCMGKVCR